MFASGTGGQFLELVPIIDNFIAAGPSFFEIVEDGLSWVVAASAFCVLLFVIVFETAVAFTPFVPFGLHFNYEISLEYSTTIN